MNRDMLSELLKAVYNPKWSPYLWFKDVKVGQLVNY